MRLPLTILSGGLLLCCSASFAAETLVDPRSGKLLATSSDVTLRAGAVALELRRDHVSEPAPGQLLPGWVTNWDAVSDSATSDSIWKVTLDSAGRIAVREAANGNRIQASWGVDGRLARLDGPHGSWMSFAHDPSGSLTVTTSTAETLLYRVESGRLASVKHTDGRVVTYGYDTGGRLTGVSDPADGGVKVEYDPDGRVVKRSWPGGASESYAYEGTRTTHVNEYGLTRTFDYAADGGSIEVTDSTGAKSVTEIDSLGRATLTRGPGGETSLSYDGSGRLAGMRDGTGTTQFTYDDAGRIASLTHPDGTIESIQRDSAGNPTQLLLNGEITSVIAYREDGQALQIDAADGTRKFEYDAQGRMVAVADSLGRVTRFAYNERNAVVKETNAALGVTTFAYDDAGRLTGVTDPLGRVTSFGYDAAGRLASETSPDGITIKHGYDARGRRTSSESPEGRLAFENDRSSRTITTELPGGGKERMRFSPDGSTLEVTSADGATVRDEFGPAGELTMSTNPLGGSTTFRHDPAGRLTTVEEDGKAIVQYDYDPAGRLATIRDARSDTRSFTYNAAGHTDTSADTFGNRTRFEYDAAGRLAGTISPAGLQARFIYDSEGQLTSFTRPSGVAVSLKYDALGNLARMEDARGTLATSKYNEAGELVGTADGAGRELTRTYDAAGRLVRIDGSDGSSIVYAYDDLSRIASVSDAGGTTHYHRDDAGRVTRVEYEALAKSVRTDRNAAGLRTRLHATNGRSIGYEYERGSLSSIKLPSGGSVGFVYTPQTALSRVTFPNDVTAYYHYDDVGRLAELEYRIGEEVLRKWTVTRDEASRPASITEMITDRAHEFTYDAEGRLTKGPAANGAATYAYGPDGARSSVTTKAGSNAYRYDGDLLVAAGSAQFEHDAAGHMKSRQEASQVTSYAYNAHGQLASVHRSAGELRYTYDEAGQRVARSDARGTTRYIYYEDQLLEEHAADGKLGALFVHGPGTDWPLAMIRGKEAYYYHLDPLGNVAFLTDAKGRIAAEYEYDAFGALLKSTGDVQNPLLYAGREYDRGTGLYHFRARWYDPQLGRFLTPDPDLGSIENPASLNPYVYALASPTIYGDPTGLAPLARIDYNYWRGRYGISASDLNRLARGVYDDVSRSNPPTSNKVRAHNFRIAASRVQVALERAEMMPDRLRKGPALQRSVQHQIRTSDGSLYPKPPSTGRSPIQPGTVRSPAPTTAENIRSTVREAMGRIGSWFRGGGGGTGGSGGGEVSSQPHGSGTRAMKAPGSGGDTLAMNAPKGAGGGITTGVGGSAIAGGVIGATVNGIAALASGKSGGEAAEAAVEGGVIGAVEGAVFRVGHNAIVTAAAGSTNPLVTFAAPRVIPFIGAAQVGYVLGTAAGNMYHGNKAGDDVRTQQAEKEAADAEAAAIALLNDPQRIAASAANAGKGIADLRLMQERLKTSLTKLEEEHKEAQRYSDILSEWIRKGSKGITRENANLSALTGTDTTPGLHRHVSDAARHAERITTTKDLVNQKAEEILKAFETEAEPPASTPALTVAATKLTEIAAGIGAMKPSATNLAKSIQAMEEGFKSAEAYAKWVADANKSIEAFEKGTLAIQNGATDVEAQAKAFDERKEHLLRTLRGLQGRVPPVHAGLFNAPIEDASAVSLPDYQPQLTTWRQILPDADKKLKDARDVVKEMESAAEDEQQAVDRFLQANRPRFSGESGPASVAGLRRTVKQDTEEIDATFEAIKFVVVRRRQKVTEWLQLADMIINTLGPDRIAKAEAANDDEMKAEAQKLISETAQRNEQDKKEAVVLEQAEATATQAQAEVRPMVSLLGIDGT